MIDFIQYRYGSDNLGYILFNENSAIAVDPGRTDFVMNFLKKRNLELSMITNTHSHFDHTGGNADLSELSGLSVTTPEELASRGSIHIDDNEIRVIHTPGHTSDSICLHVSDFVVTGDTLFIANVGNCSLDIAGIFLESIDRLQDLPDETRVLPGHDYTDRSIARAISIEKENRHIHDFLAKYSPPPISSTIGDEKRINPYIRSSESEIKKHLASKGMDVSDRLACFRSFLELY